MVNPARAGMILEIKFGHRPLTGKPRASGDDPNLLRKRHLPIK